MRESEKGSRGGHCLCRFRPNPFETCRRKPCPVSSYHRRYRLRSTHRDVADPKPNLGSPYYRQCPEFLSADLRREEIPAWNRRKEKGTCSMTAFRPSHEIGGNACCFSPLGHKVEPQMNTEKHGKDRTLFIRVLP